jgi:Ca2+-binding EF-hand superfamily protein
LSFDADGDGELDAEELAHLLGARPADLEFLVRLGKRQPGTARLELLSDRTAGGQGVAGLERVADNNWALWLAGMKVDLRVLGGKVRPDAVVRFYQAHFFATDTDGNGYLVLEEARQSMIYRDVFAAMDADHDEKLYPQEVLDYLQHRTEVTLRRTELAVDTYGGALLAVLDADRDGRLGQRELREAPLALNVWDHDGDGRLAPGEFPRELHLTVEQGRGELPGGVMVQAPEANLPRTPRRIMSAPFWFEKMDRNRDGDLSPREFLGSREVFESLDADHDGLVDGGEAARAGSPE